MEDESNTMHPVFAVSCIVIVSAVVAPDKSIDTKSPVIDEALVPTPLAPPVTILLAVCLVWSPRFLNVIKQSRIGFVDAVSANPVVPPNFKRKNLFPEAVSPAVLFFHSTSPLIPIGVRLIPLIAVISEVGVVIRPDGAPPNAPGDPTICGWPPVYWSPYIVPAVSEEKTQ